MDDRLLKRIVLMVLAFLFLLSCNKPPNSLEFQEHPASHLLVSDAKIRPNSVIWSIDWSTSSLLTLLVAVREGQWPVYVGDIHTGSLIPVTRNGKELWSSSPKLSPNGTHLAYQSIREYLGIYVATLDNQSDASFELKDEHLAVNISNISSLDWANDSQRLAVLSMAADTLTLYVYDLLSEDVQELFTYKEENISYVDGLAWSPDGNNLAFVLKYSISEEDMSRGQSDVFIYYIDQNRLVRLTTSPDMSEAYPSWFPKGDILTYTSTPGMGGTSIGSTLVFSAKDGKCTKVVPGLEGIESPSWSPDGTRVAFKSSEGVEIMDVMEIIPPDFLSVDGLCKESKR